MTRHWTYGSCPSDTDIQQGDLVRPSPELKSVIGKYAQYFLDPKYVAFAVTTQTCDMAIRGVCCRTAYISFSPIRLLGEIFPALLDATCTRLASGVYAAESKYRAKQLCERMLNQNEENLGLFYLHPDSEVELGEPAVVTLRVGFVLRAEHYELVRSSRIGRLGPEYQSRLGWLVGNIFSRVAVAGWEDRPEGKKAKERLIGEYLGAPQDDVGPLWVQQASFKAAEKAGHVLGELDRTALLDLLAAHAPKPSSEILMGRLESIVRELFNEGSAAEAAERVVRRIRNDEAIRQLLGKVDKCQEFSA